LTAVLRTEAEFSIEIYVTEQQS